MESWTSRQTFINVLTAVLHTSLVLVRIYCRHKLALPAPYCAEREIFASRVSLISVTLENSAVMSNVDKGARTFLTCVGLEDTPNFDLSLARNKTETGIKVALNKKYQNLFIGFWNITSGQTGEWTKSIRWSQPLTDRTRNFGL